MMTEKDWVLKGRNLTRQAGKYWVNIHQGRKNIKLWFKSNKRRRGNLWRAVRVENEALKPEPILFWWIKT